MAETKLTGNQWNSVLPTASRTLAKALTLTNVPCMAQDQHGQSQTSTTPPAAKHGVAAKEISDDRQPQINHR
jgi:hypothetical protein